MSQGTAQKGVQPVSDNGGSLTVDGTVAVSNLPATQPVSGTVAVSNFPATQPVSGTVAVSSAPTTAVTGPLTDTQLRASAVPVSGTFFQATQPVSIAATLPVSGPLTDTQLRASAVPVSGPLTDTQLRTTPVPVSGTVTVSDGSGLLSVDDGAGSLTVDSTQLPAALAASGGMKIEGVAGGVVVPVADGGGSLTVDAPVGTPAFVRLSDGAAAIATLPVSLATNTPDVTDRAARLLGVVASITSPVVSKIQDSAGNATETTTKGTSGTRGLLAQDFKDTGRTRWSCATVIAGVAGVAVEAVLSMVVQRNSAPGAAATTQPVTAAKRLRLASITISIVSTAAAVVSVRAALRCNPGGAAIVTSPIECILAIPSGAALAQAGGCITYPMPDGMEFSGTEQITLSHIGSVATYTLWASLNGFEY